MLSRAGGGAAWKEVLRGFWGPFQQAVTATSGVGMTQVIDALDALVGAHFFPGQASLLVPHASVLERCQLRCT